MDSTLLPALLSQLQQGAWLWAPLAGLVAGGASSLLPCSVAVLPLLLGYIGGLADEHHPGRMAVQVGLFVLGLALVLSGLGVLSAVLGVTFSRWLNDWLVLGLGFLAVVMGLQVLGLFHAPLPGVLQRLPDGQWGQYGTPLVLGLAYGLLASPCGTPFLVAILAFTAQAGNVALGACTLFAYALGQGVLLLLAGLFAAVVKHRLQLARAGAWVGRASGALFVATGGYLVAEALKGLLETA